MTLKFRLHLSLGIMIVLIQVISFSLFILMLSFFYQRTQKNSLIAEGNEIIRNHLTLSGEDLFLKRDDQGNSLSAYLRDEGLSAIVYDKKGNVFAAYGVYHDASDPISLSPNSSYQQVNIEGHVYWSLILPVINSGKNFGNVLVARIDSFAENILPITILISIATILLSIILSGLIGSQILNQMFRPLDALVTTMHQSDINQLGKLTTPEQPPQEVKEIIKSYNTMVDRLSEGVDAQKRFVSNASHELKTPIASAITVIELADLDISEKKFQNLSKRLITIREQLGRLNILINDLLTLSSIKSQPIVGESIQVEKEINKILLQHQSEINLSQITVSVEIPETYLINFPKTHFQLIFENLISNAIKYNRKNGNILIKSESEANHLKITVADTGVGVSPKDQQLIHQRFYRAPDVRHRIVGHGLGLSIVKEILDYHQLNIEISSTPGQGTEFTISGFKIDSQPGNLGA